MKSLKNKKIKKKIRTPITGIKGIGQNNFNKRLNSGDKAIEIISSLMKGKNLKELPNRYNKNTCKYYVFIINSLKER